MTEGTPLQWVSPSAVARLQSCGLAEYRRRSGAGGPRPSSPHTRLGNAAHRVLEWIAVSASQINGEDAETLIASRWRDEAQHEFAESLANPYESSSGSVEQWPTYGRIGAGLKVDGALLAAELADLPEDRCLPERELQTADGAIRGTADLILLDEEDGATVIDHKTGSVASDHLGGPGRYEQQLLLYVAMARDSGYHPRSAEIRPLGRSPIFIDLSSEAVDAAIDEAHDQMTQYNEALETGDVIGLARPSETSCGWCPYILDCPAIWNSPSPDLGDLMVIEGVVQTVQKLAASVALKLETGQGDLLVTGLPSTDVRQVAPSDGVQVRLSGIRASAPGQARSIPGRAAILIL
jgi:hypothetical protein